ncbi:MAG: hypothetical protein J6V36_03510, partial [Clostridia bacterium]|nr:hypothetical protein [Clostridia bacterium]
MNMHFYRKLPIPKVVKEMYPLTPKAAQIRDNIVNELKKVFSGEFQMEMFELLKSLCEANGTSGNETEAAKIATE